MKNLRIKSAQIIQMIFENKVFFGEMKKTLPERDLPFVNMLVLSTVRHWNALNVLLDTYLSKKIPNKHRLAKYLLILAINEMLFMNTAEYAIINETVNNIKKCSDKFLGRLANAILRKIALEKDKCIDKINSSIYIPDSFIQILDGYSSVEKEAINNCIVQIPPLDLSVKSEVVKWAEKLSAQVLPNGSIRILNCDKIHNLTGYKDGQWWVQDIAASLPVIIMGDIKGKNIVDLCAAPGGKTAQLLAGGANVTALDISASRLEILQQNMQRLGFSNVQTQAINAISFLDKKEEVYDAILLDAPCSATGTFRRHPEVLFIKSVDDVHLQAEVQRELLDKCANVLKIGGFLIYSVCSIAKEEGELQIKSFLSSNQNFKLIPINMSEIAKYGSWKDNLINEHGCIRTLPFYANNYGGMDSFFICKLQRII